MEDLMDTSNDGENQEIVFGTEKINEYRKRLRDKNYYKKTIHVKNVENIKCFKEEPRLKFCRLPPFSDYSLQTGKIYSYNPQNQNYKETQKEQQRRNKEGIKFLLRKKRYNKKKALEFQTEIKREIEKRKYIFT